MVNVEVRGGVIVAVYSDDTKDVTIIDHDDNAVSAAFVDPLSAIPKDVAAMFSRVAG